MLLLSQLFMLDVNIYMSHEMVGIFSISVLMTIVTQSTKFALAIVVYSERTSFNTAVSSTIATPNYPCYFATNRSIYV